MTHFDSIDSSNGNNTRVNPAAYKNPSDPKSSFSKASHNLGLWGENLAKRLHESRYLYATYGALDGLSNICSHWRYVFDLIYFTSDLNSDDKLHEFLSSPEGFAIAGIETILVMGYATIGNYFDGKDKNRPVINFLSVTWPYLRDFFKGSKNTYKGILAALKMTSFLSGTSLLPYVVPSSLGLGFLSVISRLLMRDIYSQRKIMMKNNTQIWQNIQNLNARNLSPKELEKQGQSILDNIQNQSENSRFWSMIGAGYGGTIDGLYYYTGIITLLGVPGLLSLSIPVALFLISCSFLYGITNIINRLYEEKNYQKKLDISIAKANLAYTGRKIECLYHTARKLNLKGNQILNKESYETLKNYLDNFENQRQELSNLETLSYESAFLLGLTHGLSAYGVLASIIFAISTVTFLIMQTMPPTLLIIVALTIASGLFFMATFAANAVYHTYQYHQLASKVEMKATTSLKELKSLVDIGQGVINANKPDEEIESAVRDCMVIDRQPSFFFMELFEVIRSFFSGIGKGTKSVLTFNTFQEIGDDGHYHFEADSWIFLAFTSVSSCVYAICLALRAYARGFGRPPIDCLESNDVDDSSPTSSACSTDDAHQSEIKVSRSSDLSLFSQQSKKAIPLRRAHSESEIKVNTNDVLYQPKAFMPCAS